MFLALAVRMIVVALACVMGIACAGSAPGASTDASIPDDGADDASSCKPNDLCCLAMHAPGQGRECSPTNACDPSLDCIYAEGCIDPKGKCQPWARCPDSAVREFVCQCDGGTGASREVPISAYGDACAP